MVERPLVCRQAVGENEGGRKRARGTCTRVKWLQVRHALQSTSERATGPFAMNNHRIWRASIEGLKTLRTNRASRKKRQGDTP